MMMMSRKVEVVEGTDNLPMMVIVDGLTEMSFV
jgi:hypothetical protein